MIQFTSYPDFLQWAEEHNKFEITASNSADYTLDGYHLRVRFVNRLTAAYQGRVIPASLPPITLNLDSQFKATFSSDSLRSVLSEPDYMLPSSTNTSTLMYGLVKAMPTKNYVAYGVEVEERYWDPAANQWVTLRTIEAEPQGLTASRAAAAAVCPDIDKTFFLLPGYNYDAPERGLDNYSGFWTHQQPQRGGMHGRIVGHPRTVIRTVQNSERYAPDYVELGREQMLYLYLWMPQAVGASEVKVEFVFKCPGVNVQLRQTNTMEPTRVVGPLMLRIDLANLFAQRSDLSPADMYYNDCELSINAACAATGSVAQTDMVLVWSGLLRLRPDLPAGYYRLALPNAAGLLETIEVEGAEESATEGERLRLRRRDERTTLTQRQRTLAVRTPMLYPAEARLVASALSSGLRCYLHFPTDDAHDRYLTTPEPRPAYLEAATALLPEEGTMQRYELRLVLKL